MDFDKKLFELACRDFILDSTDQSKYLREHLSLIEHAKVYNWVKNKATYEQLVSIIISEQAEPTAVPAKVRGFEDKAKKALKYGLAATAGGIAAGGLASRALTRVDIAKKGGFAKVGKLGLAAAATVPLALLLMYLYRKFTDPCRRQCKGDKVCFYKCEQNAVRKVVGELQAQKGRCTGTKNPEKCSMRIDKEIKRWQKKEMKVMKNLAKATGKGK